MLLYELGGYYLNKNQRTQLALKDHPSIDELNNYLDILKNNNGVLVLSNNQEEYLKPYDMTLYSDNERYLILFSTMMEDGDIDIRTFNDKSGSREFISMLGEPFAIASTTKDFSLVIRAFSEFLETGDVSRTLLD